MAQLTIANSNAQHYVKMLCTTTTKPPSTSKFYVDFQKHFFKDQKNETPLSIVRCFAPCQVDLWVETLPFSAVLPPENAQTSSVAICFTHKAQLLRYCRKRSFLGVAMSGKVTLYRVPWFGRHVENWGDVIIYPVLVVARTALCMLFLLSQSRRVWWCNFVPLPNFEPRRASYKSMYYDNNIKIIYIYSRFNKSCFGHWELGTRKLLFGGHSSK